ncbi:nitroreductase family protein [Tissierella sp. MSJ-40]|uniref:Nitroreductase family protein n=1 Tax=Tissierella simiarum TaxID=2841534 RepID=A0ABS6E8P5_9FIRM|nr:nitroreductase family protein [Tissierella simiarum]MBU5439276.1 nitroreductase family protein [Tissierella simiarum]
MLDYIYNRHSIRKFQDKEVPMEDLKKILKAATQAPSGKNLQNWHFVVVKNKEKLNHIAKIIEDKVNTAARKIKDEEKKSKLLSYLNFCTFFKAAPLTVFLFVGPYPITGAEIFLGENATEKDIAAFSSHNPGIQNIGAAMENLLLAAASLGYGGCWMTGPMFAKAEIQEYLGFTKEGYSLACMTPIGVPVESELHSPKRKPLEEVVTIIE